MSIFRVIVLFMLHLQNVFENNKDKIIMNVRTHEASRGETEPVTGFVFWSKNSMDIPLCEMLGRCGGGGGGGDSSLVGALTAESRSRLTGNMNSDLSFDL